MRHPILQSSSPSSNRLLALLARSDLELIRPNLMPCAFSVRTPIETANEQIDDVYFPEVGIVSVVAVAGQETEVGLIGREGMTGTAVVMGDDRSPHSTYIQVAGSGHRLGAEELHRALKKSPSLRTSLLVFAQAFAIQVSHTALSNARARIDERLARWLLMAHDRLDGDELPLTHEFLALMLGVRRAGVTEAMKMLETRGYVEAKRARVEVLNRRGLEKIAGRFYGTPEAEYRRLTAPKGGGKRRGRKRLN